MKTLLLLRHAKSSWNDPELADFDRPLNARGRRAAPKMGALLAETGAMPDLVLCSTAVRARQTCEALGSIQDRKIPVSYLKSLYMAAPGELMAEIRRAPDSVARLLLIGHNPGLETLADRLSGSGEAKILERMREKFPTAALAELAFAATRWADLAPGSGRLLRFIRPRELD